MPQAHSGKSDPLSGFPMAEKENELFNLIDPDYDP